MPDFDVTVIVYCKIYGVFTAWHQYIGDFAGEKFGNWHDGKQLGILPPTHWKSLPKPPNKL